MKGSVSSLKTNQNGHRTYGFIYCDDDQQEYFFHKSELRNCNIHQIEEGDVVEFTTQTSNGKVQAVGIRKKYQSEPKANIANPGINPNVNLKIYNEDEQRIISFLKKTFYVTSGGDEFSLASSTYRYCLIKPTDYFVQTFQMSREIVVVFTDYVHFEPRSLDAASYVYRTIGSQLRLDRGIQVLICHDNTIEEKLSNLLRDNNVNSIVIPFTYDELLDKHADSNLIKDRFRKYLFDTDLFLTSKPIQNDIFFFGRRDLVHDIVSKCKNNTNCGVFGLRRSGKTSVLFAVQALLKQQGYPTVFVPCESDLSSLDWRTALCRLVHDIYKELNFDVSVIDDEKYQSFDTVIYFERDLYDALKELTMPITIMFDEIEAITFGVSQGEDSQNLWLDSDSFIQFWNTIKGYYSKYPKQLSLLVAGTNPMINEVPIIGKKKTPNPMYRTLSESNQGAYLPAFTNDDTKHMVNTLGGYMGIQFNEYAVSRLTSDCGGHPYLMRILCSHINKYIRNNNIARPMFVTQAIYDKAIPEFEKSSEATGFFWMILNILMTNYPKEFETLKVLALQGDSIVSQIQEKEALFHLIGYGLIENNQNNYAIKYNTITRFLRGKYRFERVGLSIEEQKSEIQLRVNNAEIQLRKLVKNILLAVYGAKKAKECVINAMQANYAIDSRDITNAESYELSQLFDTSINKMYFSVLRTIIIDNLSTFSNVFEGCSVDMIRDNLNTINISRRCPDHSYTEDAENWTWDDFLKFRESITWLENILKDYE